MKKILLLFLTILMAGINAKAAVGDIFEYEGLNYEVIEESETDCPKVSLAYTSADKPTGDLVIPSQVPIPNASADSPQMAEVVKIGDMAFDKCKDLKTITIPNTVIEIGWCAFHDCFNLSSVNIPASVTKIDAVSMFSSYYNGLSSLENILVDKDNTVYESIDGVLYQKDPYILLAFPCKNDITEFTIPNSVTRIENYACECCESLTSVIIPNSVTEIGHEAFKYCSGLTSVTIPDSVTKIGSWAFSNCYELTSLTISDSVTEIGAYAFDKCFGLTSITIPASVKKIGEFAFGYQDFGDQIEVRNNIKTIYTYSIEPPIIERASFNMGKDAVLYVPKGSMEAYKTANNWSYYVSDFFSDIREMGVVELSLSSVEISIEKGESETVTATVNKGEDVTIESESWSSSDPEVATVENGVVTAVSEGDATITYSVTDNYGATHTATCLVSVSDMTGIESVDADSNAIEAEYFNMNGIRVEKERLLPGIYIKRHGVKTTKVMVK